MNDFNSLTKHHLDYILLTLTFNNTQICWSTLSVLLHPLSTVPPLFFSCPDFHVIPLITPALCWFFHACRLFNFLQVLGATDPDPF